MVNLVHRLTHTPNFPVGHWVDPYAKSSHWPIGYSVHQMVDLLANEKFGVWVGTDIMFVVEVTLIWLPGKRKLNANIVIAVIFLGCLISSASVALSVNSKAPFFHSSAHKLCNDHLVFLSGSASDDLAGRLSAGQAGLLRNTATIMTMTAVLRWYPHWGI